MSPSFSDLQLLKATHVGGLLASAATSNQGLQTVFREEEKPGIGTACIEFL